MPVHFEPEKIVLNLDHLGFGFQICFFSAYFALVTFVGELTWYWGKKVYRDGWDAAFEEMERRFNFKNADLNVDQGLMSENLGNNTKNCTELKVMGDLSCCFKDENRFFGKISQKQTAWT